MNKTERLQALVDAANELGYTFDGCHNGDQFFDITIGDLAFVEEDYVMFFTNDAQESIWFDIDGSNEVNIIDQKQSVDAFTAAEIYHKAVDFSQRSK